VSTARRVMMTDVNNRPRATWVADLSEETAEALANISLAALLRAASPQPRNAAREASARHYAAANYR
jgi:hypothetical protein